jgi:LysR family transcriptional regulator, regulator of abg operon
MKLAQLRYVAAIADQGSLRAAARHLGVAQPAFSRSIAELERELGAALFERRARGMIATPLGQAFVRRANAILNDVRRARDEFEQLKGNAAGEIAIGLSIAAHLLLLPGSLRLFRDRHPKVRRASIRRSCRAFRTAASISISVPIRACGCRQR